MGKVGKAGKAVVMKKTNQLLMVKDQYVQPPGPGELVVHNVYTSVNPVDCYMRSGLVKVQFFPKVRVSRGGRVVVTSCAWHAGSDARPRRTPQILGSDVAGQVVMAPEGSKARRARRSQRCCGARNRPRVPAG